MDWIYPVSYLVSLSSLVTWFFAQGKTRFSRPASALFLTAYFVYLAALAFSSGETAYKLLILVRDMLVMGIVVQIFNVLRKNVLLSVLLAVVAVLIVFFSYFRTLDLTFPQLDVKTVDRNAEFLIHIRNGNTDVISRLEKRFPCRIERAFHPAEGDLTDLDEYYLLNVLSDRKRTIRYVYDWLFGSGDIIWVEPNEVMSLSLPEFADQVIMSTTPAFLNDPEIKRQWGFGPTDVNTLHTQLTRSGLRPRKPAKIAILDTGVDAKHEDLQQNYISTDTESDTDPRGHGTHCAGIAGAVSNNGIGIASLSPGAGYVQLTSIRAINASGSGTQQMVIDAMIRAVDQGADVLSLSLGGFSTQKKQKAYEEAVKYADKHGAIVVVAAGNNNVNADRISPANVRGVIAVAAVDQELKKATFSNTVQDIRWGVSAPGVEIYSTLPSDAYGSLSGTSMATPFVAGLVGLMKSFDPGLTAAEVFEILDETGKATESGKQSGKLIQPVQALQKVID